MKWLRKLMGTDFPDPVPGQVWRSRHSGRAVYVHSVRVSDCGQLWHIELQHEGNDGASIHLPMSYCMFKSGWRRMLREEGRELVSADLAMGLVPKPARYPYPPPALHGYNVNQTPIYERPPAPPRPWPFMVKEE